MKKRNHTYLRRKMSEKKAERLLDQHPITFADIVERAKQKHTFTEEQLAELERLIKKNKEKQ